MIKIQRSNSLENVQMFSLSEQIFSSHFISLPCLSFDPPPNYLSLCIPLFCHPHSVTLSVC